jgi:4-amino-4-deoxy-L-arabinose transferase-like glycosyltransferase
MKSRRKTMNATINEFLLLVLLFAVYFCAASTLMYHPQNLTTTYREVSETASQSNSITPVDEFPLNQPLTTEPIEEYSLIVENENLSFEPDIPEIKQEKITDSGQQNNLHIQTETIINNLNKRQSRQLCKSLGIQQKHGKVEKILTFIKAEIRSIFKDEPERVIATIQERLPELIFIPPETSVITDKIAS